MGCGFFSAPKRSDNSMRRFIARNLDNELGSTAFDLAREARTRFRHTRPVKHVDLVVARRVEADRVTYFPAEVQEAALGVRLVVAVKTLRIVLQ